MLKRRVFAWLALVFFVLIVVNILFIHVYVTESAVVFLIYVLVFFFGARRNMHHADPTQRDDLNIPNGEVPTSDDEPGTEEKSTGTDNFDKEQKAIRNENPDKDEKAIGTGNSDKDEKAIGTGNPD